MFPSQFLKIDLFLVRVMKLIDQNPPCSPLMTFAIRDCSTLDRRMSSKRP